jgi:hypothetical protein
MSDYKNHPYYTHQPYLIEILKQTTGDILECGCGDGSTLVIKKYLNSRKLFSVESNHEWLDKYVHLEDENHKLFHVNATNEDTNETGVVWTSFIEEKFKDHVFEIVFIDSSPWTSRTHIFNYFKDKAKIIIIHDFDYFPNNNLIGKTTQKTNCDGFEMIECDLDNVINNYKLYYPPYKFFAGNTGPPTLICSNLLSKNEFNTILQNIEKNLNSYYD